MRRIDPDSEFSVYPLKSCEITDIDIKNDNCLKDCSFGEVGRRVRGCSIQKKPVHGLVMKNGGYNIDASEKEDMVKGVFNIHTNNLIQPMYNLLRGIHKINKTHAHLDIKGLNILYNNDYNKLYLIDFGLLSKLD